MKQKNITALTELAKKSNREKQFLFQAIRAALMPITHLEPCFRGVGERALQQVFQQGQQDAVDRLLKIASQHLGSLVKRSINQGLDKREFSRYLQSTEALECLELFAWQIETHWEYYQELSESLLFLAQSDDYRKPAPVLPAEMLNSWKSMLRITIYWVGVFSVGLLITQQGDPIFLLLAFFPGLLAGGESALKKYGGNAVGCLAPGFGAICGIIAAFFFVCHEFTTDLGLKGLTILVMLSLFLGIVGLGLLGRIFSAIAQEILSASEREFRGILAGQGCAALLLFLLVDGLAKQTALPIIVVLVIAGGHFGGLIARRYIKESPST